MFGASVGNLFKTGDKPRGAAHSADVREGATYFRRGPGELTEKAKVTHVGPDAMGITHVHFQVMVGDEGDRRPKFEDSRTLNIETFTDLFSEAVEV